MARATRREVIRQAAAGLVLPTIVPSVLRAGNDAVGANQQIGIGAIGVGNRARQLLEQLPADGRIVALCDCNLSKAEEFRAKQQADWPIYQDYRRLLDHKDIDAVIVGTGEFQRVLPCIEACQAEKDVYAEKPLTLYIREGRALVDAVRRHERVCQVGTQQRSMAINRIGCELIRSGGLGKVLEVRALNYSASKPTPQSPFAAEPVPSGLDWSRWLNQAAMRPFNEKWLKWMQWRDFAGGEMTNWGAHGVDQVQWALGMDATGPIETWPIDGGDGLRVGMRYANGIELKFILDKGPNGGAIFVCEHGKLEINRNKLTSNPPEIAAELLREVDLAEEEQKWSDDTALWQARWHLQNWLDCIRTRERPAADVETGHRSVTVCHLANITRQVGEPLRWDPVAEQFVDHHQANQLADRRRRQGYELPVVT